MNKIALLLITILTLFAVNSCTKKTVVPSEKIQKISANEFVLELEKLGYFKYAEEKHIANLKSNFIQYFDPNNELVTIWDDETGLPLDFRYYTCDGETVYEQGGFTELLSQVKPTFDKIGLSIDISEHFEEWDSKNNWLNHRITINDTEYIIFKNFKDYGWGEAVMRFAQIINQEAEKQGIEERVYLVSGGNDGRLIFLTKDLYKCINDIYTNEQWKPLEVDKWINVMKIKPMNLN